MAADTSNKAHVRHFSAPLTPFDIKVTNTISALKSKCLKCLQVLYKHFMYNVLEHKHKH